MEVVMDDRTRPTYHGKTGHQSVRMLIWPQNPTGSYLDRHTIELVSPGPPDRSPLLTSVDLGRMCSCSSKLISVGEFITENNIPLIVNQFLHRGM